ncbi:hypothetical protein, partial [Ruminococcus callidus]|uniref:hypothetical protein n=1 Tax=Ruminococcus callidus TaxID=40519 RepID=UPI0039A226B0
GKGFLGNMTENLQADCVQSRQAGFMQRFLRYRLFLISYAFEKQDISAWRLPPWAVDPAPGKEKRRP